MIKIILPLDLTFQG